MAQIHYDIVGDGEEYEEMNAYVENNDMGRYVTMYGRVSYDRIKPFFDNNNIGISFVPMTDYYDYQPPTKTFEYALSGMYVIATGTMANRAIISSSNGCIINDSSEAFLEALISIYEGERAFDSLQIRNSLENYKWQKIVEDCLIPIIEE